MKDWKEIILKALSEKKGDHILAYDTTGVTPFMDTMIIVSAANTQQAAALAQNVKDRLFEQEYDGFYRLEGNKDSRWLLVDLKDVVVHIFTGEERKLYNLEKLYADCPVQEYED